MGVVIDDAIAEDEDEAVALSDMGIGPVGDELKVCPEFGDKV